MGEFVSQVALDQHAPQRKWLHDMLFGMTVSGSPMLSEIGRALDERTVKGSRLYRPGSRRRLIHTEKRLSRNLNSDRLDDEALIDRYLNRVAPLLQHDRGQGVAVCVDYTDVRKPFANLKEGQGMQHIAMKWDGSEGELSPGYGVAQVEAHTPRGITVPLVLCPYSSIEPGHLSFTTTFLAAMKRAAPAVGPEAWWALDRGFDSGRFFEGMDEIGCQWVVRLNVATKNERALKLEDGRRLRVSEIAKEAPGCWTTTIKVGRRGRHSKEIRLDMIKVRVLSGNRRKEKMKPAGPWRTLVVMWGFGKNPTCLLVSRWLGRGKAQAKLVQEVYHRRWKAEEATRCRKDSRRWGPRIEDLRALKMRGVKRLCLLVMLLYGFFGLLRIEGTALVEHLIGRVQAFGPLPPDPLYRLARGAGAVLTTVRRKTRLRWRER